MTEEQLRCFTAAELKERCLLLGLVATGKKADLRKRLLESGCPRDLVVPDVPERKPPKEEVKAVEANTAAARFLREELFLPNDAIEKLLSDCPKLEEASTEAMLETLQFLEEELQPGRVPWALAVQNDAWILLASKDRLKAALVWLEEFLWNQDWAVGFGRQAVSNAIQHKPKLLYQGVEGYEETTSWLEEHGLDDDAVRTYVRSPTAVPFPVEPYPWIELLQIGAGGLEEATRWVKTELQWTDSQVSQVIRKNPHALLLMATASGKSAGQPYPGYPLPVSKESWLDTQIEKYKMLTEA